jgi:hypothetical protein
VCGGEEATGAGHRPFCRAALTITATYIGVTPTTPPRYYVTADHCGVPLPLPLPLLLPVLLPLLSLLLATG